MRGKELWAVLLGSGLALGLPAEAMCAPPGRAIRVHTRNQTLGTALLDIARQSGIELIVTAPIARTTTAPKVRGHYSIDEALSTLLAGSGLTFRRSADGAYVVTTLARAPAEDEGDALPEIMVVGKRTQNSDIRRRESDIQPYKVWTGEDVAQSHSSDINDFLRNRLTSNAQMGSALQAARGDNMSRVDLRGLGSEQTLVLVDGRRLPGGQTGDTTDVGTFQPDLNGIPLSAIDRIEVLNSAAGGIHGPGATAGVVNIILKRDYHGADAGLTFGQSSRGDAAAIRIDARAGFSSKSGSTQAMLAISRTWGADLRVGEREFAARARALQKRRDPAGFVETPPVSSAVNISGAWGDMLSFDPIHGGGSLGASTTTVPVTYGGVAVDGGALYLANAGQLDSSFSSGVDGAGRSLLTRPRLASLLANLRHRFGDTLEAYVDLLMIENAGSALTRFTPSVSLISADAPTNPFQQDIFVSLPLPGYGAVVRYRSRTARLTGGLILDLPHAWKANLDYSVARASNMTSTNAITANFDNAATFGYPAQSSGPLVNPLAGQAAFLASIEPLNQEYRARAARRNDFHDLMLRLAGPILELKGGPLSLSLLAEDRREHVPAATSTNSQTSGETRQPAFGLRASSAYAELRAPITDRDEGPAGLRGLEVQLAVRHDITRSTIPKDLYLLGSETLRTKATATVYTTGLRFFPVGGVMFRASMATGFLPPAIGQIGSYTTSYTSSPALLAPSSVPPIILIQSADLDAPPDPLRGRTRIGSEAVFSVITGGSTHLRPERARSISAGIVIEPIALERLRVSVDYTRIDKTDEIADFHAGDRVYFLAREGEFPDRVIRAPLTAADRAKGYSGGIVTAIDTTRLNVGKTVVEAIDFQLSYRIPTDTIGDFRLHAATTWQPRLTRRYNPEAAKINSAGYADGPLKWRANGGIDWQRGALDLGVNVTYYHSYLASRTYDSAWQVGQNALLQASARIPSQLYFDLYATRRLALQDAPAGLTSLDIRFGIENLFDHRPPIIVDPSSSNYSLYGDPRLRRFELSILGHF